MNDGQQFLLCALLSICTNFFGAFSSSYPASSKPAFLSFFNNSYIDRGHSTGAFHTVHGLFWTCSHYAAPLGNLLGCAVAPFCIGRNGPKSSILLANVYALVASLISSLAILFEFPELLLFARLVASAAATLALLALVLFLQQVPAPNRCRSFSFLCPFSISIIECSALFCNFFCPGFGQKLLPLVGLPILPQSLGILLAIKMPETPQFILFKSGDREKAVKALNFYRGELTAEQLDTGLTKIVEEQSDNTTVRNMLQTLFAKRHRRLAALLGFCALQLTVGGRLVLECSAVIISARFGHSSGAQMATFVLLSVYFLSTSVGLVFAEKIGRRLLLQSALLNIACLGMFICLDSIGQLLSSSSSNHLFGFVSLPFLLLYATSLGSVLRPISYFLTAELSPMPSPLSTWLLSLVFGLGIASTWLFSSLATLPLFRMANSWVFLPLHVLPSLVCLLALYKFLPETRAREKADIVKHLQSGI